MKQKEKTRRGRPNLVDWDAIPVKAWRENLDEELRSYIKATQGYKPSYQAVFINRSTLVSQGKDVKCRVPKGTRIRHVYC